MSLESIVFGPRLFPWRDPAFWNTYRDIPAWQFVRFEALAGRGKPQPDAPWERPGEAEREREDLEASFTWTKRLLADEGLL